MSLWTYSLFLPGETGNLVVGEAMRRIQAAGFSFDPTAFKVQIDDHGLIRYGSVVSVPAHDPGGIAHSGRQFQVDANGPGHTLSFLVAGAATFDRAVVGWPRRNVAESVDAVELTAAIAGASSADHVVTVDDPPDGWLASVVRVDLTYILDRNCPRGRAIHFTRVWSAGGGTSIAGLVLHATSRKYGQFSEFIVAPEPHD